MPTSAIKKLLYLSNLAFLALYLTLSWHNRLTLDDFHFMTNVHQYGVLKGTKVEYNSYSTRWLSVLVVHSILSLIPYINALFLMGVFTLIAAILTFSYLLKNISQRFLSFHPGNFLLINLGIFFANALFYSSIDIGNIWFWLSAIPTYLWSFIFFLLGCGIIISGVKFQMLKFFVLALSFFYIGSADETFAAVILIGLFMVIFWLHFSKHSLADKKTYLARLYIAIVFCLAALIILYIGHGNTVRRGLLGEISLTRAFALNIETTGWIGLYWISRILPFVCLYSLPLLYVGKILSLKNKILPENMPELRKKLSKAVLLYGLLIFIFNYPITYLLCGIAPGRALLPVSFLTWVLFAFSFFYIGYKTVVKEKPAERLAMAALAGCMILNTYNGIHQFTVTRKYDKRYDALIEELLHKKNNSSVIAVSSLPPSGMLTAMDISHDSLANYNMFIKNALGLKADIMLAK